MRPRSAAYHGFLAAVAGKYDCDIRAPATSVAQGVSFEHHSSYLLHKPSKYISSQTGKRFPAVHDPLIRNAHEEGQTVKHEVRGMISMSRIACPYDNAMAESFMKTLKTEEVEGRPYRDLAHARSDIGAFIEEVCNKHRLHSGLAYRSPEEFEETITIPGAAAQQPLGSPTTCP